MMIQCNILLLLLVLVNGCFGRSKHYGEDLTKPECKSFGRTRIEKCGVEDVKIVMKLNSITWSPKQSLNMTLDELKSYCENKFVCLENTGCYKDFVNYQELDSCIEGFFKVGPWSFCEDKMRAIKKKNPEQLEECTKSRFGFFASAEKFDCFSIYETAKCYLKDVEKHCDPEFFEFYKQHYRLRLYNRACDGRLRYRDWDYKSGQNFAINISPGVFKAADPKRDFNSTGLYSELF